MNVENFIEVVLDKIRLYVKIIPSAGVGRGKKTIQDIWAMRSSITQKHPQPTSPAMRCAQSRATTYGLETGMASALPTQVVVRGLADLGALDGLNRFVGKESLGNDSYVAENRYAVT